MTHRATVHQVRTADAGAWIAGEWAPPKPRRVWSRVALFAAGLLMFGAVEALVFFAGMVKAAGRMP